MADAIPHFDLASLKSAAEVGGGDRGTGGGGGERRREEKAGKGYRRQSRKKGVVEHDNPIC